MVKQIINEDSKRMFCFRWIGVKFVHRQVGLGRVHYKRRRGKSKTSSLRRVLSISRQSSCLLFQVVGFPHLYLSKYSVLDDGILTKVMHRDPIMK